MTNSDEKTNDECSVIQMRDQLLQLGRRRVPIPLLRQIFFELKPELHEHPDRNSYFRAALESLTNYGFATLPKRKASWDLASTPPLPHWIQLTVSPGHSSVDAFSIAWVNEMSFCIHMTNPAQLADAIKINQYLIANPEVKQDKIPLRERSLEIFGDEKRLDSIVSRGTLFGGRLSLDIIGAFCVPLPIPHETFECLGRPILLIENHHTFWSLCRWNTEALIYSAIAYTGGSRAPKHEEGILALAQALDTRCVEYFGDIDFRGVLILSTLVIALRTKHQLNANPAQKFYSWLVNHGIRCPGRKLTANESLSLDLLLSMFDETLATEIKDMLHAEQRIPQESLSFSRLQQNFS